MLTYLVIFVQEALGLSALAAGVRFLPLSLSLFVAAGIAGRLSSIISRRLLITPGFLLIGAGLLLMRGLTMASGWTHLLPGMIVSGVGAGVVNVPLIATAVGVVSPAHAGMASGINSTFRQIGITTGVAVLGAIFIGRIRSTVLGHLAGTALAGAEHQIAVAAASGFIGPTVASLPAPLRPLVTAAAHAGFVDALNLILLVAALLAFLGAVFSFFLIRERDFLEGQGQVTRETEV